MFKLLILIASFGPPDSSRTAGHFNDLAKAVYKQSPDSALAIADQAIRLGMKQSDLKEVAWAYSLKGIIYKNQNLYDSSITNHIQALRLREQLGDPISIGKTQLNIGNVYYLMGDMDKTQSYYLQVMESWKTNQDTVLMIDLYSSLGNLYSDLDNYSQSQAYYQKGLDLMSNQSQDERTWNLLMFNIGVLSERLDKDDQALQYYRQTIAWYESESDYQTLASLYGNMGVAFRKLGFHDSSKYYLNKAIVIGEDIEDWLTLEYTIRAWLKNEFEISSDSLGLLRLHQLDHVQVILDSLKQEEAIRSVEAEYQVEKKELAKIAAENKASNEEAKRKIEQDEARQNILILSIGGGVALLTAIFVFIYFRQKNRLSAYEIKEKNDAIHRMMVEQEALVYEAQMEGENVERKRIANELHDRVGGLLATANLYLEDTNDSKEQSKHNDQIQEIVQTSIQEIRSISHNLSELANASSLKIGLQALEKSINGAGKLNMTLYYELDGKEPHSHTSKEIVKIVRELITNTLKHGQANKISLQLSRVDQELTIFYEDNGRGFDLNTFVPGLGIKSIQERTKALHGTISFDTRPGYGLTVILNIPTNHDTSTNS